jgi:hypothetical protein
MNTKDLIQSIVSGENEETTLILNTLLKNKVKTEIDLQRVSAANKIFNDNVEVVEEAKKEVEEGNEFTKAAAKAVIDGEEEFEFNGKTYKATIDKEAAKKILGIKEDNLEEATKTKEVTVDQFFSKYFGTKSWAKDADFKDQIDMMSLGSKEIADLVKNKNKKVKVTSNSNRFGGWLTSFSMGGYTIEVESMDPVTEFA